IAFNGKIGVLWSKQTASGDPNDTFYFSVHNNNDPDTTWQTEIALRQVDISDDHINLKADSIGNVFAVVKTSVTVDTTQTPRILVLPRDQIGAWTPTVLVHEVEGNPAVAVQQTRPIMPLDEANPRL